MLTSSTHTTTLRSMGVVTGLAAIALILGCTQAPPAEIQDPPPTVLRGNAVWSSAETDPNAFIAASLWMLDGSVLEGKIPSDTAVSALGSVLGGLDAIPGGVSAASVVEIGDGFYLGGLAALGDDGSFDLALPDGDAIPAALLGAAEDTIPVSAYVSGPACSLVASDPEALTTFAVFEGVTLASPVILTPAGLRIGYTVTEATDIAPGDDLSDLTFVSLVYATAPTTLSASGTDCTPAVGFALIVDVDLEAGWNQLTWDYVPSTSLTVGTRPMSERVFSVVVGASEEL